jgi:Rrf2 family nitric oxide-sensitive transcriptional repressor
MEILHLEIEREEGQRATTAQGQLAALDQLFDDALGAFISVLDEHTLEQMIKVQRKDSAGARSKAKAKPQRRTKTLAVSGNSARRQPAGHG